MKKFQMPIRYDTSNISEEYCIEVSNKFKALNATTEEMRPEELANKAKEIFTEASKHLKTKQQKQKWLSDEALQKMQKRIMAKSKGQHHEDYKKKAREVKQIIRRDKKKYIEDKCEQIENNFSKNRSRDAYHIIKSLIKHFNQSQS
ncbi:endonuclease/exonuclease/phosphatase family protein [Elysia marginata]|uniref:Endonuclease/exonuclease/phosphatase family protein n=1 Tax=Elysia marginata TaxID=1093978 RepID=A0AAV4EN73_9GAST|nr:endonuclease/exonuclease/phosphatase family protein [Elysia marginata]